MSIGSDIYGAAEEGALNSITPPWFADFDTPEKVVDWTRDAYTRRSDDLSWLRHIQRENLARYMGYYYTGQHGSMAESLDRPRRPKAPKIGINQSRILVEQRVSKTNKITPRTTAVPANGEASDRIKAKTANKFLETLRYNRDYDALRTRLLRRGFLGGDAYFYINWNKHIGPDKKTKPKTKSFQATNYKTEYQVQEKYGDVDIRVLKFEEVIPLLQYDLNGCSCYGVIIPELKHILEAKALYPHLREKLEPTTSLERFNELSLEHEKVNDHVLFLNVYIRSGRFAPEGMHWVCTPDHFLHEEGTEPEIGVCPIKNTPALEATEFGNLPVVRFTDVDVEGYFHAASAMSDINTLQNQYDKLTSFIMRNIWLYAHPKFVVPQGGVNMEQLSSGALVVQSSGAFIPQVVSYPVISQDVFKMWEQMPALMGTMYSVYDHSLGKAPAGTRSASQLMIYDEQEEEARETTKKKLQRLAIEVDTKALSLMSSNYKVNEPRFANIMGEDKQWQALKLDLNDLRDDFVIRIEQSTLLPENKYARVRTLFEMKQIAPNIMSDEQFADAVDIGQHEKFIDYAKLSILSAEAENEKFLRGEGKDVIEPKLSEDLLNHWRVHAKLFQNLSFKALSEKEQQHALDHMNATEYLIFLQCAQNPMFKQKVLQTLEAFPLVFVQPEVMAAPGEGTPLPQEDASKSKQQPPTFGQGDESQPQQ